MARIIEWDNDNEHISFEECIKFAHKYKNEANYEVALKYYNKAHELNPYYCSIYKERSDVYKKLGMNNESNLDSGIHRYLCNEYEYATNDGKNVDFMPALKLQIQAELYQQNYLLNFDFTNFEINNQVEETYIDMFRNALDLYTELLKSNPNDWFLFYNRGICYYNINEYTKALEDFTKSIELNPQRSMSYNYRSLVYKSLNMLDEAEIDKRKIEELKDNVETGQKPHDILKEIEYMFGDIDDYPTSDETKNPTNKKSYHKPTKGRKLDL